ncbi:hypothetical protein OFM39_30475, partial [Escherichia coli]|nr:hypothetical protein [Escherichia coli]
FPIMIDHQFDLDEVLTFEEMSIQQDHAHDHHHDHDHQMIAATEDQEEATRNPNNNIPIAEAASAAAADVGGSCAVCMESFHAGECRE